MCSSPATPAKIFFINLFNDVVDIRLGDETKPIFLAESINPYGFTALTEVREFGKHILFFKPAVQSEWNSWFTADNDSTCNIEAGKTYCITITIDGSIHFFTMTEDNEQGAKICFLNGSQIQISDLRIAVDSLENKACSIQDLESDTLSNFYTVAAGNYLLFWQFTFQKETDEFFFYTHNMNNQPEPLLFTDAHYYLFCIYTENDAVKALFFDITP
ncbi:MAG: hypothetical protein JW822_01705 [Spirochaetales bacterium]|nr:hypothetical protein [Spirochaetales bacterium]